MKVDIIRADKDPTGPFRFSCIIIVEAIPNLFERLILGRKREFIHYKGDCCNWYKQSDNTEVSFQLKHRLQKYWVNWCWENYL